MDNPLGTAVDEPELPPMSSDPFRSLRWKEDLFGLIPGWTYEPDISSIEKTMEAIHLSTEIQVKFLTQGGFNKIYKVHHNEETYIMRVSLPVQPVHKTKS
ncbi:hypothetical protein N7450_000992 [Penicillium hetheringtonii]|uniref:Aminoglycoside phosphotransferase domain-containing protein n=1 Tax=Penicillium hetheringtonii TaxID=911720 RepID=A0AAD6H344_9EURO|nr:hypothetical protein N7450_000992 [Penicillium hetheringtonii]